MTRKVLGTVLLALLAHLTFVPELRAAESVAMITDLTGRATLRSGGASAPAELLAYLAAGTELKLEAGARVTVTFFSKPLEVTLTGPAQASIAKDGATMQSGPPPRIRTLGAAVGSTARKFEPIARERLALAAVVMRSGRPELKLLAPANTKVLTATPEFAWTEITGAQYRLVLAERNGKIVLERALDQASFKLEQPLRRAATYTWHVQAQPAKGEALQAETTFSVASAAEARTLAQGRPAPKASFSQRVLYATRLDALGFRHDAAAAWRALRAERPEDETLRRLAGDAS